MASVFVFIGVLFMFICKSLGISFIKADLTEVYYLADQAEQTVYDRQRHRDDYYLRAEFDLARDRVFAAVSAHFGSELRLSAIPLI